MRNIVSKEMIGLIFESKNSDDKVVVYGILNYALCKDAFSHSVVSNKWAEEKGETFLEVRFKSIIDNTHKSMPLESFFEYYGLLTQKFDNTKWIS